MLRERFTHMFAEHTFIGTAVCEHCKGMVSVCLLSLECLSVDSCIKLPIFCADERNSEAGGALQGLWH